MEMVKKRANYIQSFPNILLVIFPSTLPYGILKINTLNVDPILDTFIRYGYTVKNSFVTGEEEQDSLRERYGLLMKYLEL